MLKCFFILEDKGLYINIIHMHVHKMWEAEAHTHCDCNDDKPTYFKQVLHGLYCILTVFGSLDRFYNNYIKYCWSQFVR